MSKCAVVGCKSEHNPFNPAVSFHRVTRNKKYLPLWERIVKLKTKSVQAKICSLHFKDKDFDEGKGRRVLKSHAVPSFNVIDEDNSTDDDDDDNEKLSMLKRALRASKGASMATESAEKISNDSDDNVNDRNLPQNFQMVSCCDSARPNSLSAKQTSNMGIQTKIKTDREISLQAKVKLLELRLRRRDAKISHMQTVLNMIKKHTKGTDMEYKLCCELQNITEPIEGNLKDKIKSNKEFNWKDEGSSGEEDICTFVEVVHSPNLKACNGYDVHRQDRGSSLRLTFLIRNQYSLDMTGSYMTEAYVVNRIALVRFKFEQNISHNCLHTNNVAEYPITLMISTKLAPNFGNPKATTDRKTKLNVSCKTVGYYEELFCTENWTEWLIMGQKTGTLVHKILTFDPIEISMVTSQSKSVTFANLYDDLDLIDFYLSTSHEKVPVHKACLAAHSDVFRAMLSKEWKETGDAQITLQGITLNTLQYFKKYIYLGTLPDDEEVLRQLLVFASCYMMDTLKTECISKLSSQTTGENLHNLVEYACENNLPELMVAILEQTPDSVIKRAHDKHWQKVSENSSQCTPPINITRCEDDFF